MSVNSFDNYPLTWMPDKDSIKQPYYISLSEDLENKIRAGQIPSGVKLPPQREIADYLGLNYTTITRVYNKLKNMGLLYGIMGKGTFVAQNDKIQATITQTEYSDTCIDLASVTGFSEYCSAVEEATKTVFRRDYLRTLYEYTSPTGHTHQRQAALRWLEQMGVHSDLEHVAIFSGAQNALTVALMSLFRFGDRIAVDFYTYSNFIEVSRMLGIKLIPIKSDEKGMLPEELDRACFANEIRGLYIMPSCSNPTAISIPIQRRMELCRIIENHNLVLIEDDISAWAFAANGEKQVSFYDLLGGNSVYICGMTKSLCPGLRIGYMCYGEKYREEILHGLFNINIKTSSLDAEIITEMILNGSAYEVSKHKLELTKKADELYRDVFKNSESSLCYYRWLPINSDKPGIEIERELKELGVRIYHSDRFKISAGNTEDAHLRISICSAGNFQKLTKGLSVTHNYLQSIGAV